MKRSEMIKKMVHDTFQELQGENMQTPDFPYKVAELMLEVCEKEGMLKSFEPETVDYLEDKEWRNRYGKHE